MLRNSKNKQNQNLPSKTAEDLGHEFDISPWEENSHSKASIWKAINSNDEENEFPFHNRFLRSTKEKMLKDQNFFR